MRGSGGHPLRLATIWKSTVKSMTLCCPCHSSTFRRISCKVFWGANAGLGTGRDGRKSRDARSGGTLLVLSSERSMSSFKGVGGSLDPCSHGVHQHSVLTEVILNVS